MKTAELTGALLDYWVARAEGWTFGPQHKTLECDVWRDQDGQIVGTIPASAFQPSTNWAQGGPILERMRLLEANGCVGGIGWYVRGPWAPCDGDQVYGDTLLEAAMRAYITSKFGGEVPDDAAIQAAQGE